VLLYGSSIWSSGNKNNEERLFKLQKRAARVIMDAEKTASTVLLFNSLNWVPFYTDAYINKCALVFTRLKGSAPEYIKDLLPRNCDLHDRNTRFAKLNLNCPRYKRESEGGRSFAVRAIRSWNSLNVEFKRSPSAKSFKRSLFKSILSDQKRLNRFS